MPPGRNVGRGRAVRVFIALTAVSTCLGAVAYAATRPEGNAPGLGQSKPVVTPPQDKTGPPAGNREARPHARFVEHPEKDSVSADAWFRFHVPPRSQRPDAETEEAAPRPSPATASTRRFQCRIDSGKWTACGSPHRVSDLALGAHTFAVRALDRAGRPGPAVDYSWRRVAPPLPQQAVDPSPVPFSIELRGELDELFPGHPPQQVAVVVTNPNPSPIEVTSLTVAIDGELPSCSAENFVLTQSSVSSTTPLTVPANASLELPTATASAPTIAMLNLPVNQDPCQGVEIPLVFSGEAHG
jgi:hypothetical protein